MRVNFRFNKPLSYGSKKHKNMQGEGQREGEEEEEAGAAASPKKPHEHDIDIDHFTLGDGPLQAKKEKLNKLKDKLVDDDALRGRFNKKIQYIRIDQAKSIKQMDLGVHTNPNIEMLDRMYNASFARHRPPDIAPI